MLWGDGSQFANHWGYWQDWIKLFNASNPSGKIVDSRMHSTILKIAVSVSAVVAVKRFVVGLYLGRQTFSKFAVPKSHCSAFLVQLSHILTSVWPSFDISALWPTTGKGYE